MADAAAPPVRARAAVPDLSSIAVGVAAATGLGRWRPPTEATSRRAGAGPRSSRCGWRRPGCSSRRPPSDRARAPARRPRRDRPRLEAPIPTPETFAPAPLSPYGASKLAGETYVSTWGRAFGVQHVSLRLGNVYGPRQNPFGEAGAVAIFSERLLRGDPPIVYGYGKPTRDYVHVSDVKRAFTLLADQEVGGVFNVGWGREVTVLELLDAVQRAAGTSVEPRLEPLRPGEHEHGAIDSSAAAAAFGWRPEIELDEGIAETFRWYASARVQ